MARQYTLTAEQKALVVERVRSGLSFRKAAVGICSDVMARRIAAKAGVHSQRKLGERKLSPAQWTALIARARAEGWVPKQIAYEAGLAPQTVRQELRERGEIGIARPHVRRSNLAAAE